jgi:hypothetical protein
MRMSARLQDGLRVLAAEREMTLAEFIRGELWKILDRHQRADGERPAIEANAKPQSISGTGEVPVRYRRR